MRRIRPVSASCSRVISCRTWLIQPCHRGYATSYRCDVDEEPVSSYKPGGYHPVQIGDHLGDGRYKVLHKVGWGAFSTVWAARDKEAGRNVALKIMQAAASGQNRELDTLCYLKDNKSKHPGIKHKIHLHDFFEVDGPNGEHDCLVLDLTGPSVQDYISHHVEDRRLSAPLVKSITRQVLTSLSYLHDQDIGHGDLHLKNLTVGVPALARMSEADLYKIMGEPMVAKVTRTDGRKREAHVPPTLVKPAVISAHDHLDLEQIQLVDFGAAFKRTRPVRSVLNSSVIRAPEAYFGDVIGCEADLWSMGCTLFELICGQTPFETRDDCSPESIARRMLLINSGDDFPEAWQDKRRALEDSTQAPDSSPSSLQKRLEELYLERGAAMALSKDDVRLAGALIASLLRFDPGRRVSADEALKHEWLQA